MVVDVVATAVHVGWQRLARLLRVLELHVQKLDHVLTHFHEEDEDLLLSRAEEHTVLLVESEVGSLQNLVVLIKGARVAREGLSTHVLDLDPHVALVLPADRWDVVSLEHVVVHIVGIVAHVPLTSTPLSLDLVQQGDVLVELHESEEGNKFVHDWLLEVSLNSEHLLHVLHA